ncbi:MAG: SDR family NAD(P)-dependent oxidoreductase [Bacteroidetes bacterium]|nr:MAG: SDR family NAD(P)-dependent oxidoreductase [Bacteroidota bacterium]
MPKNVFITGASSGIGYACAELFARKGYNLILNARRESRIADLSERLQSEYGIQVRNLIFDVRERESVFAAVESLSGWETDIDILVNNAGLALGMNDLPDGDLNDWEQMIDTNVKGLLYVSKALIPGMKKRQSGHIFNVGSIAGRETYLKGNVYCATKHAVHSLTKAMRIELVSHNIKVSLISPGATETEFSKVRFKGDDDTAKNVYRGFEPLKADDIAQCIVFCAELPLHVNVDDMLIMPTAQASATIIHKQLQG